MFHVRPLCVHVFSCCALLCFSQLAELVLGGGSDGQIRALVERFHRQARAGSEPQKPQDSAVEGEAKHAPPAPDGPLATLEPTAGASQSALPIPPKVVVLF